MTQPYQVQCDCGAVELEMQGKPRVQAFCHCEDCRTLLNVPYHSVVAWNADQVHLTKGEDEVLTYKHPHLEMTRVFCKHCGETLFNTNAMNWHIVSQLLISKCNNDELPPELQSTAHFYYDRRVVDVDDQLPKNT